MKDFMLLTETTGVSFAIRKSCILAVSVRDDVTVILHSFGGDHQTTAVQESAADILEALGGYDNLDVSAGEL